MKRLICYIIFTCFCVLNTWAQTYDDYVEKSLNAIEADSLLAAESYIRQAIEAEPDNPINAMLLSNLGTIQRRRQQYEQANGNGQHGAKIRGRDRPRHRHLQ